MTKPAPTKVIASEVIARMSPKDALAVLGKVAEYLDSQKLLNVQRADRQGQVARSSRSTPAQREQAANLSRAHHVAAVAHDIGLSFVIKEALMANSARDRAVLGEQPAERP